MGHVNIKDCAALASQQGVKLTETVDFACSVCATAKQRKIPMPDLAERREVAPGEILHCDLKGPLDLAYTKAMFALVVVDENTRVVSTQALRSKSDVPRALEIIFSDYARHPLLKQIRVCDHTTLHTDSEAVLGSARLAAMLAERGVSLRASPPYAHERNGIAERSIQSLFDLTRALLQQAGMNENMWPVALRHAVYLRNRSPSQALGGRTPMQLLGAAVQPISKIYTFGAKCFVKVDDASRRALEPKSRVGIYVGENDISFLTVSPCSCKEPNTLGHRGCCACGCA